MWVSEGCGAGPCRFYLLWESFSLLKILGFEFWLVISPSFFTFGVAHPDHLMIRLFHPAVATFILGIFTHCKPLCIWKVEREAWCLTRNIRELSRRSWNLCCSFPPTNYGSFNLLWFRVWCHCPVYFLLIMNEKWQGIAEVPGLLVSIMRLVRTPKKGQFQRRQPKPFLLHVNFFLCFGYLNSEKYFEWEYPTEKMHVEMLCAFFNPPR